MHINHWYHKKKQPIAVDVFFFQLVSATGHVGSTTRRDIIIVVIIIVYIVYSRIIYIILYHKYPP